MRRKKYVGKILKTSDGFLRGKIIKYKNRLVVVIAQRKDGAIAVSKIHALQGKNTKDLLNKVVLKPRKHKSLNEDSAVDTSVIWGRSLSNNYGAFYIDNFLDTNDRLSNFELLRLSLNRRFKNKKHFITYKKTKKKWLNFFGNKPK